MAPRIDTTGRVRRVARTEVADLSTMAVHADMGGRRGIGVGAFLLALVTAGAMAHVGVRMKGIEVAYDLGRERKVNTQLEEERRRLNIEIGMLKDPTRVVGIARDKLQMGPPAQADIVRLGPGVILGARSEAHAPPPGSRAEKTPARPRPRGTSSASAASAKAPPRAAPPVAEEPAEAAPAEDPPAAGEGADE